MLNHNSSLAARTPRWRVCASALLGAALLLVAGCASPEAKRAAMAERMGPPQPALAADGAFFAGALTAHATLTSVQFGGPPDAGGGQGGGSRGGGGGMRGGMGGGHGGGMGGPPPGGGGGMGGPPPGAGSSGDSEGGAPSPMMAAPRSVLRVAFTNATAEAFEISVLDAESVLGNFAVRPEKLTLAPGQVGELLPMHSTYNANLDAVELKLRVRRNGQSETQTLNLVLDPTAPVPPPPPAR